MESCFSASSLRNYTARARFDKIKAAIAAKKRGKPGSIEPCVPSMGSPAPI
jgi:hypothetical protein